MSINQPTGETQTKLIGSNGSNPLPIVNKLWDFYSTKSIKTVFVSVGTSTSPIAELEVAETLGCPLHVVEYDECHLNNWNKVVQILNTRKDSEPNSFTHDVVNKWILGKNLRISNALPFFSDGSVDLSGVKVETVKFEKYIRSICDSMNITPDNYRCDLLNIQLNNTFELVLLYALTHSPYRPGLLIVSYTNKPDSDIFSTQAAAHLQNVGYMLLAKEEHKFLYMFNDKNVYEFCSFESTDVDNPLVYELVKSTGFYNKSSKPIDA